MKKSITLILLLTLCLTNLSAQEYKSFLTKDQLPDGTKYLPVPPDTASVFFYNDYARYNWGKSLRNTPRGQQALHDVEMDCAVIMEGFAKEMGIRIDNSVAPELMHLCNYVESDACNSTNKAKKAHMRKRPYVQFNEGTIAPEEEASHIHSGSYPSSHAATGWALALVLAEIDTLHQEAILRRGYEFGQSRVIAGYHYQSDVDAARLAASAAVARLHADESFMAQLARAKKEFRKLNTKK